MKDKIFVSDFDGTITKTDTLAKFLEDYADPRWLDIEIDWREGKFGSQECLIKQFALINNMSEPLVDKFLSTIELDEHFISFSAYLKKLKIPILILSDGLDYFINKILEKHNLDYINVITNHAYFNENKKFIIEFPNDSKKCKNNAGTCKCKVVSNLKKLYKTVYYAGDGASDFCVASEPHVIFAKSSLAQYCRFNNINYINYNTYNDILNTFISNQKHSNIKIVSK